VLAIEGIAMLWKAARMTKSAFGGLLLLMVMAGGSCQQSLPDNGALAARIERQVQAAHPHLDFTRYARFYAHAPNSAVEAIYVDAQIRGRPGETRWTAQSDLPNIEDAGCGVVMIEYDAAKDVLRSSRCGVGDLE
jgi:hypothetical protein